MVVSDGDDDESGVSLFTESELFIEFVDLDAFHWGSVYAEGRDSKEEGAEVEVDLLIHPVLNIFEVVLVEIDEEAASGVHLFFELWVATEAAVFLRSTGARLNRFWYRCRSGEESSSSSNNRMKSV